MTGPVAPPPLRQNPFWTWTDAVLLAVLSIPCFSLAIALTHGAFLLMPRMPGEAVRAITLQFAAYLFWFGALWLILRQRYQAPFWDSLGWRFPWPNMLFTGVLGPGLVILVAILGELLHTPVIDNAVARLLRDRWSILLVGSFAVTLGPLAEELIFRGFIQPLAVRSFGKWLGISLASVPFAVLHGPQYAWNWQHMLLLFLASFVFGYTRHRTGSTAASTVVHATYNLTFFVGYLAQRPELLM
ncbi:MAG: CPBP family intramembrane glutamic endopeptidase [Acidobacteriota bacterium]